MAFKMKGMSFGEGTGYKSPQLMKKESAMKMKKEAAMKMKKDSAMDLNYDSAMKMKKKKEMVEERLEVAKEKRPERGTKVKTVTTDSKGNRTVTKKKLRRDGTLVEKVKNKNKRVVKKTKPGSQKVKVTNRNANKGEEPKRIKEENASPLKAEKMYGGDKTYAEAQKKSKGNMNNVIKQQRAYESKKRQENPDWNKKDDNAWKARQNKINEYAGSKKRYDVKTGKQDDGGKVKVSNTKTRLGDDKNKTVIKNPDGDKSKLVETKNKEGDITSQKTVEKTVAGTEKFKKKYDEDGKLIRVRGYATGDNKEAARKEKKRLKEEARKNRKANRKA
tara:strand:+ start:457 stop:1452 length:996 start_codon:yes stop_codon:yes gene_type:complete